MAEPDNFEEDLFADLSVDLLFSVTTMHLLDESFPFSRASDAVASLAIADHNLSYADDETVTPQLAQPNAEVKTVPVVANGANEIKGEDADEPPLNTEDDNAYKNEQDADDEVDFNLGNGNDYSAPPPQESHSHGYGQAHGPGIKEDG